MNSHRLLPHFCLVFCLLVAGPKAVLAQGQDSAPGDRYLLIAAEMLPGVYDNMNQYMFDGRRGLPENDRHKRIRTEISRINAPSFGDHAFLWVNNFKQDGDDETTFRIATLEAGTAPDEFVMTIGGSFGSFLFPIPLIVVCVVIASLIECFIVLPGHLRHSLQKTSEKQPPAWRRKIDVAFRRFQDGTFRSILQWSIENRRLTLSIALASIILTLGLVLGGRLGFSFFPQPEGTTITANARFVAGAPEERVARFLEDAQEALGRAEAEVGEDIITLTIKKLGEDSRGTRGSNLGYMSKGNALNDSPDSMRGDKPAKPLSNVVHSSGSRRSTPSKTSRLIIWGRCTAISVAIDADK